MGLREFVLDRVEKQGVAKGFLQGAEKEGLRVKTEIVKNLLETGKLAVGEIANIANVSEAFVLQIMQTKS